MPPVLDYFCGMSFYVKSGDNGEPMHVHVVLGKQASSKNLKVWITENGIKECYDRSGMSDVQKAAALEYIASNVDEVERRWNKFFGVGKKYHSGFDTMHFGN